MAIRYYSMLVRVNHMARLCTTSRTLLVSSYLSPMSYKLEDEIRTILSDVTEKAIDTSLLQLLLWERTCLMGLKWAS